VAMTCLCPTRAHLQHQYDQVNVIVDNAAKRLLRVGICSSEEVRTLSEELESACDLLDRACAALDWHIQQHRCTGKPSRNGEDAASSPRAESEKVRLSPLAPNHPRPGK
jgi:hypothetical protein